MNFTSFLSIIPTCSKPRYEATQFKDTFRHVAVDYNPSFGSGLLSCFCGVGCLKIELYMHPEHSLVFVRFVVVQKRINTRIFQLGGKAPENPAPGTVLDHTVIETRNCL